MGAGDVLFGGLAAGPAPRPEYQHQGQLMDLINGGLSGLPNRAAPQLANGPQAQARGMQLQQAQQLQGIASGQQQGAGELAVQRQMQNALAGQQAMARMRGAGGAGFRDSARASAGIGLSAAGMGQQAAMQDQQAVQGLLQNALSGMRGQDVGVANANAQLQQNQTGMNDAQYMALLQSLQGMDANQLQARMAAYQSQLAQPGLLGPALGAGGQILGAYLGAKG